MIDVKYLGSLKDVAVCGSETELVKKWEIWKHVGQSHNCAVIAQLYVNLNSSCSILPCISLQPCTPSSSLKAEALIVI